MLKEFFEAVVDLANKSARPTILHPESEPDHHYILACPDGSHKFLNAQPEPRDHTAHSIPDFCSYLLNWSEALAEGADYPVVWFSREKVVGVLDDELGRRNTITLPLQLTPQIKGMAQLADKRPHYTQQAFISLLRIELAGCLSAHPTLVDIVRKVKFRQSVDGKSEVGHGKASVGRAIEQELTGSGQVPEEVILRVPVFLSVPGQFDVPCAIEIATADEKFQLIPFPGTVERAVRAAEEHLGVLLRQELESKPEVFVFFGQP